jgi:tRNA pseudouridine32 synthase/23S rRNA pseudouridine746 synthase
MGAELTLLHCDEAIIVTEKPGGLLAVPGRGPDKQDCVVSRIRKSVPDLPDQPAVHRLDMHTSGLMVLARDGAAHRELSRQFQHRLVLKRYVGLVAGEVHETSGSIELAFRLDPDNRPYQVYDPVNGKPGVTLWKKLEVTSPHSRIEFTPLSGRTHQIRLHAAHPEGLGAPIVGDALYGTPRADGRMFLHASYLSFNHPLTGDLVEFISKVPF